MLNSKTAVVTGSVSGIGLAIAEALAEQGVDVLLHGLADARRGAELAESVQRRFNVNCWFSGADLRDPDAIAAMFEEQAQRTDGVDILVNNAGVQHTDPMEKFPRERWDEILAVNLSAAFHASAAVLPSMQRKGWGRIINIASAHGLVASRYKAAYCATKFGLVGLTKVAALENAGCGITVNAICPGWVETALIARQIDEIARSENVSVEEAKAALISGKQPMSTMTRPAAIGAMAVYLCSDAAATITGAALSIDGGWTAQ